MLVIFPINIYFDFKMIHHNIASISDILDDPESIRNISLIAHVDSEKAAITSALIAAAGVKIETKGERCYSDPSSEVNKISIKSSSVSLAYELNSKSYLINLIDLPSNVDFSSDVATPLMINDGAVVVVDVVEGVSLQTESVLRQTIIQGIRPILLINNIDRAILEEKFEAEEIFQKIEMLVNNFNEIVKKNEDSEIGDFSVHPLKGNVVFGSGKDNWAFTIQKFARIYSEKFDINQEQLAQKLWGDVYYDKETKKWINQPISASGQNLKRSFVQFIMEPIMKLTSTIIEGNKEQISTILSKLNIKLTSDELNLKGSQLLCLVFSQWINLPETLIETIILNLPSPKVAQKYRCSFLYEGPQDDPCAKSIQNCDAKGPLMMYISKMIPREEPGRFYAFGRVFSGTVSTAQKVRIMGPNYIPGRKEDLFIKSIFRTLVMMGENAESFSSDVSCGNVVCLIGIDKFLTNTGTISDNEDAQKIRNMKSSDEKEKELKYV